MERIRIAVVGLNFGAWMIEHELLSSSASKYIAIAGVCDYEKHKAREWADKLQVACYADLDEVLADSGVEAVALFSGPVGRARVIERIIEAGKHVMTTKPFGNDASEARAVLTKARMLGKTVHLNSPSPVLQGDLLQVQEWVRTLHLGRPIAFRAETTCCYRELENGSWYDDPALCPVAPVFRIGIYLIHDLIRFFGEVEAVSVQQSRIFTGRPTPDNAQIGLLFRNGAIGNIFASFCIEDQQYYKNAFVMNFERGTIYRNMGPRPRDKGNESQLQVAAVRDGEQMMQSCAVKSSEGYQWDIFHQTVRGERTEDPAYADHIVSGIRVIEMMRRQGEKSG